MNNGNTYSNQGIDKQRSTPSIRGSRNRSTIFSHDRKTRRQKCDKSNERVRGAWNALAPPFFLPTPFYIHPTTLLVPESVHGFGNKTIHGILLCRCVNSLEDCGVRIVHRSSGTIPCRTRNEAEQRTLSHGSEHRGERIEYRTRGRERERGGKGGRCRGVLQVLASNPRPFQTSNYRK